MKIAEESSLRKEKNYNFEDLLREFEKIIYRIKNDWIDRQRKFVYFTKINIHFNYSMPE